jgi:tape measure domain-containing protein
MAKLGDLVVRIGADTRDLNKQLGRVQRNMRSMTSNITQLGASMTQAITLPLAGVAAMAVKSAADLEQLETSFVSLTGGVEEAAAMMQQLNDFTAKTPFQIENVANAARQLIASGTKVSEVNDQLQFLGDIAATSGVSIEEIAAIFAKVNAKGKVELENLNQLAERGIPIFKALADATGLPADKLGAGAVSVEQFNDTLKSFAEEGGFAAGAMERLSETAAGKFSTALDNAKLAMANIGEKLLPIISKGLDRFTEMMRGFGNLSEGTIKMMLAIGGLVAAIGPLLVMLPQIAAGIQMINFAFLATGPGILALSVALGAIVALFVRVKDEASKATDEIKKQELALTSLNRTQLALEAGVKLTGDRAKDTARINTTLQDSLSRVADAQAELSDLERRSAEGDALVKGNLRRKIEALREYIDTYQRSADAAQLLLDSLEQEDTAMSKTTDTVIELQQQFTTLEDIMRNWSTEGRKYTDKVLDGIEDIEEEFEDIELEFDYDPDKVISDFERMRKFIKDVAKDIQSSIQQGIGDALVGMGEAIGQMMQGGLQGAQLLSQSLQFLGNFMKQIGGAMIAQATAMIVFQKTLFTSPLAAAAAGVAFVAAGAALSSYAANLAENSIPALAEGGLAYGATTAIVGDNPNARVDPEVIAPLSKLQDIIGGSSKVEVFGRISGDDIYLSNVRASRNRNRYS